MTKKIVATTAVDSAEMLDDAFPFHQSVLKHRFEARFPVRDAFFGILDEFGGYIAVMYDAVASVAQELEIAEVSNAFAPAFYSIVENLMHTQGVTARRLYRLSPITDFAKSRIPHCAQPFPNPRLQFSMQRLIG
jgi:hypothetical protein